MLRFLSICLFFIAFLYISHSQEEGIQKSLAIKCTISGIKQSEQESFLSTIFPGKYIYTNDTLSIYLHQPLENLSNVISEDKYIVVTNITNNNIQSYSDLSILYIKSSEIYDEDKLLLNIQSCLKSVLKSETKKSIVILIQGSSTPTSTTNKVIQTRVASLLKEAYYLLDIENDEEYGDYREKELLLELDAKVLLINTPPPITQTTPTTSDSTTTSTMPVIDKAIIKTFHNLINQLQSSTTRTIDTILDPSTSNTLTTTSTSDLNTPKKLIFTTSSTVHNSALPIPSDLNLKGYEEHLLAIDTSIEWARNKTTESIQKLQKIEYATDFPIFVDNLITNTILLYHEKLSKIQISKILTKQGENEIIRRILYFIFPFYRIHIQLARRCIMEDFSKIMSDDDNNLINNIHIDNILHNITNTLLHQYTIMTNKLIPKYVKNNKQYTILYNNNIEKLNIKEYFDVYTEEILAQARVRGMYILYVMYTVRMYVYVYTPLYTIKCNIHIHIHLNIILI